MVILKIYKMAFLTVQETNLTSKSKLRPTLNFTLIRKDRDKDKAGGVSFFIHNHIRSIKLPVLT